MFGAENVRFRAYRTAWGPGGIHGDFLQAIGVPATIGEQIAEVRTNSSLSAAAAFIMDRVNAEFRRQGIPFRTGHKANQYMKGLFSGGKSALSPEVVRHVVAVNREQVI